MLTRELINELKAIASNFIPAKDLDDLTQIVFEQLLTMNSEKLQSLIDKGDIHRYFNRMCKLNYYSKNSRYYYTYNKEYEHVSYRTQAYDKRFTDNVYINSDSELIDNILQELYWYDRELFRLYVLGDDENDSYSYTTLAKKTGISRISIYYTIRNVKKYIRKRLDELRDDI